MARAAHENWDLSDLEQHLAAAGDVPAENIEACARFWRNERLKVRTGCGARACLSPLSCGARVVSRCYRAALSLALSFVARV